MTRHYVNIIFFAVHDMSCEDGRRLLFLLFHDVSWDNVIGHRVALRHGTLVTDDQSNNTTLSDVRRLA